MFDFKLRHMRADIAAIEASNNSLERQARHNRELLVLLEGLLGGLQLDQGVVQQLEQTGFELPRCNSTAVCALPPGGTVKACGIWTSIRLLSVCYPGSRLGCTHRRACISRQRRRYPAC